jgi:hypothetical protein
MYTAPSLYVYEPLAPLSDALVKALPGRLAQLRQLEAARAALAAECLGLERAIASAHAGAEEAQRQARQCREDEPIEVRRQASVVSVKGLGMSSFNDYPEFASVMIGTGSPIVERKRSNTATATGKENARGIRRVSIRSGFA